MRSSKGLSPIGPTCLHAITLKPLCVLGIFPAVVHYSTTTSNTQRCAIPKGNLALEIRCSSKKKKKLISIILAVVEHYWGIHYREEEFVCQLAVHGLCATICWLVNGASFAFYRSQMRRTICGISQERTVPSAVVYSKGYSLISLSLNPIAQGVFSKQVADKPGVSVTWFLFTQKLWLLIYNFR